MRVLICHNFYQQAGGEDEVFTAEAALLRKFGHEVETHTVHNDQIESMGRLTLAAKTIWNSTAAREVFEKAQNHRAQVVHFHNTFPLLSPAVYSAARKAGAAVVQTLHNYRLICPAATMFRDGKPCEDCLGRLPLPAITHKCYRVSRSASAVTAFSLSLHRSIGTYKNEVDAFIALTSFAREKFLQAGFAPDQVHVKPNFLDPDPGIGDGSGDFALFVGRLSQEKGVASLFRAWNSGKITLPLKICGDGPMAAESRGSEKIEMLGRRPLAEVLDLMGRASMLIFPSIWYEGFPRVIVEALARGTPVVASNLGSMREIVSAGQTGNVFVANDADDLARAVNELAANPELLSRMRGSAREDFVAKYGADRNHQIMVQIYRQAIARRAGIVVREFEEPSPLPSH